MPTYQFFVPWKRDFTAGPFTGNCFSGSDASSNNSLTVGGDLTTKEKVRNWRRKIALGQQATGNLAGSLIDLEYAPGSCTSRKLCNDLPFHPLAFAKETVTGPLVTIGGNLACPDAPVGSIDSTANALALARFAREIRDAQGSFRGSTFIAELADTLRGIRNPAKGIRDLIDHYHSRARRNARKAMRRDPLASRVRDLSTSQARAGTKAVADTWLEAQFGILPLMSDIRDAARALRRFSGREPRLSVKAAYDRFDPWTISTLATSTQNVEFRTSIHTRTEYSVRYYGAVKLRSESFLGDLAEETGFQVRDFLPALWEWIPYSFLVDYFTNIGDVLEANSISRADIAWMARTWRNTAVRDGTRQTVKPLNSATYPNTGFTTIDSFSRSQVTWRRKTFARAPYTGSLIPSIQIEIPGFAGSKKWLNIAALLRLRGMSR